MTIATSDLQKSFTPKDYQSPQDPRWCPGCGDYAILKALTKAWSEAQIEPQNLLVVSGIGCSSRLPYYTSGYGFHTLHGRGPTVALGAKLTRPELSVWLVTGDGDALSIGGNHFLHLIRRNPDINLLLFNNEIYGLTKGQASPTSKPGLSTKSTPYGSYDQPMRPLPLALTAGATFVARAVDTQIKQMQEIFLAASQHRGISVIEILTNCIIFNDGAFTPFEKRGQREAATIDLQMGKPMKFGLEGEYGLILEGLKLRKVDLRQEPGLESRLLTHDTSAEGEVLQSMLAAMTYPDMPLATGILRQVEAPIYEDSSQAPRKEALRKNGQPDLKRLLREG